MRGAVVLREYSQRSKPFFPEGIQYRGYRTLVIPSVSAGVARGTAGTRGSVHRVEARASSPLCVAQERPRAIILPSGIPSAPTLSLHACSQLPGEFTAADIGYAMSRGALPITLPPPRYPSMSAGLTLLANYPGNLPWPMHRYQTPPPSIILGPPAGSATAATITTTPAIRHAGQFKIVAGNSRNSSTPLLNRENRQRVTARLITRVGNVTLCYASRV